jgi:hypothetical protein
VTARSAAIADYARLGEQRFVGDMRRVSGRLDVDLAVARNVGHMLGLDTASVSVSIGETGTTAPSTGRGSSTPTSD